MGNEGSRPADATVQAHYEADLASASIRRMDKVIRKRVRGGITYNMKLLIRGERGTGKSSLLARLQGQPIPEVHEPTREIKTASIQWTMKTLEETVKCEVWDVVDEGIPPDEPSETDPDAIGRHTVALVDAQNVDVYQNAHCVIFLMDITKYSTLEYVRTQLDHVPVHIPTLVIGTFRDLRKDEQGGTSKRAVFKEDIHDLLYGRHKHHKIPTFRRPHEQHYFEASLVNCYGLRALHTYLGVPFLHLKVATVRQQLRLLEVDLANMKHNIDVTIANQKYSEFVQSISGADVRTGRRLFQKATPPKPETEKEVLILDQEELDDLPERGRPLERASTHVPLKIVHEKKSKANMNEVQGNDKIITETSAATLSLPLRSSLMKYETLEDFKVSNDMDKFYSSSDDGSDDQV
jgi:hypothetical protein